MQDKINSSGVPSSVLGILSISLWHYLAVLYTIALLLISSYLSLFQVYILSVILVVGVTMYGGRRTRALAVSVCVVLMTVKFAQAKQYNIALNRYLFDALLAGISLLIVSLWVAYVLEQAKQQQADLIQEIELREKVEQQLSEEVEKQHLLLDNVEVRVWYMVDEHTYGKVNRAYAQFLGLSPEEVEGRTVTDLFPLEDSKGYIAENQEVFHKKRIVRSQNWIKDSLGNERLFQVTRVPKTKNEQVEYVVGAAIDVTEEVRARNQLKDLAAEYETIIEGTHDALFLLDVIDKRVVFRRLSKRHEELSGLSNEAVKGKTPIEAFGLELGQYLEDNYNKCIKSKETIVYEEELELPSGVKLWHTSLTPVVREGQVVHIVGSSRDITELKQTHEQMARLEQLNVVGKMAASVSHEVRNPMTTVRGFLQLLKEKKDVGHYHEYFDIMISELDRANTIISEFLSLSRDKTTELKNNNLSKIAQRIYPLIQAHAIRFNKEVKLEASEVPDLMLDSKEIRQLILNLARNGIEAMTTGRVLTIKTYLQQDEVVLAVEDEGDGIAPEVSNKLGTPFLTTKKDGTGLGLSTCYSIAERHNATISVDTHAKGTTFFVHFQITSCQDNNA